MKAFIYKGRIRVSPVPKEGGAILMVLLKQPLTHGNKPYVYTELKKGQKFYELPCEIENINGVVLEK